MNNVMNEVDSKQLFQQTNTQYKLQSKIPLSLTPEVPINLYTDQREEIKYRYYKFYECRGFHNILV